MGTQLPSPKRGEAPQFSAHICCGQMAGWIKTPLGREVGLSPSDTVLDGDPAPFSQKGRSPPIFGPCLLWLDGWMDQDATWRGGRSRLRPHCARWGPSSPSSKEHSSQFSTNISCVRMAGGIKMPLGREVGLNPSDIVLDGTQLPSPKMGRSPNFRPVFIVAKRLDG